MLSMTDYLSEIEYAASSLIDLLWKERATLARLQVALGHLDHETAAGYNRAAFRRH